METVTIGSKGFLAVQLHCDVGQIGLIFSAIGIHQPTFVISGIEHYPADARTLAKIEKLLDELEEKTSERRIC
jgi:hypothetical protein